ncbi:MAG: M24 family metallopeptidase, partial [Planctomycetales bacterium]|nr:M24 family metallopeptidase [Planctomycetales bacterium]
QKRTRLLKIGWEAAFGALKPGVRYSEIRKIASDAMAKASGGPATTRQVVGPHSVGLQHTDQPYRDGLPFAVGDDLVLAENMTLT